ncbi:MAG TPA: glycosyltransferase [Thermoanaerobaculia bacterium]|nr:glycosyltransferase [Thermoanaerobaculia bacterium]
MNEHRVLFITLHFPPSRDIGAHACEQIARYFPLHGWDPVVLTRPRHLIEFVDPAHQRPFPGRIIEAGMLPHPLSIYRKLKAMKHGGTSAVSSNGEPMEQRPAGVRRWLLSMLQMPDPYTGWLVPATIAGLRAIRRERIGHIISSGPYWTNHLVALVLARITGLAWTAHYRDPWNQVPQAKPVSRLSAAVERWLERRVVRRADSVVCVTERHTRILREAFPSVPPSKFVTIPNGYDGGEWDDIAPARSEKFQITYPGGFSLGTRSPRPLFRALRRMIDSAEIDAARIQVDLFGNCDVAEGIPVPAMAAEYGLQEVVRVGPSIGRADALRRIAGSDLLLLLAEGWALQIPGKTYEYLRSGRPILALTSDGALADLLRTTGGATVAEPDDDQAIMTAIREAWTRWQRNDNAPAADRTVVDSFDRRRLASRFTSLFAARATARS